MDIRVGDVVEIPSNKVDQPPRRGTVETVLEQDPPKLEIRWQDGHVSQMQPHGGTFHVVERADD